MQQQIILKFLILCTTFALVSCDPCRNLDCISDNYYGQFRIVKNADGKDLIFGQSAVYNKAKLKFYRLSGSDTILFEHRYIKFSGIGYDSIVYVNFYPETPSPVFIKLSDTDTDTLTITYNIFKTKCCGTITEITNFRYNNITDLPGNKGTQELRK